MYPIFCTSRLICSASSRTQETTTGTTPALAQGSSPLPTAAAAPVRREVTWGEATTITPIILPQPGTPLLGTHHLLPSLLEESPLAPAAIAASLPQTLLQGLLQATRLS